MYKCYFYVGFCVFIYRAVFQNEKREDFFFNLPMSVAKRRCKTKCFCRLITHASVGPRLFFFFNWKACLLPGEFTLRNKLAASLQRQIASLAFWCMFILWVAKPGFFFFFRHYIIRSTVSMILTRNCSRSKQKNLAT